ncbi:transposase [Rhizobium sp. X9]|uniref:transposase n=1 Tax=Rhizobium sp. X9 TaxID=2815360 RepID=UPI001C0C4E56|nr:transposase [Rhizobium sp. X9]
MRGDIIGLEWRRRWGDDDTLEIVLSVGMGGATVTQVAQRHAVTRQQIYAWRHELKRKGLLSACLNRPGFVGDRQLRVRTRSVS